MDETRADDRRARKYAIKHTTRWARALVRDIAYRIDVNTLHRDEGVDRPVAQRDRPGPAAGHAAAVRRHLPDNRQTGAFILVDEASNRTVGAGMIVRT